MKLFPQQLPLYAASAAVLLLSSITHAQGNDGIPALFPQGTRVYGFFDDCECWFRGKVDEYVPGDPGVYTVRWSDGSTLDYFDGDLDKLLTVVNHAADFVVEVGDNPDAERPQIYVEGTPVYYNFDDDVGWYYGTITAYEDDAYHVVWSDGSKQDYSDMRQVRTMVSQAINQVLLGGDEPDLTFDVGTPMRYKFPNNWWNGQITEYDATTGKYTVTWTDGSWNKYTDIKKLKQMADQAGLWKVGKEDEPVQVFPKGTLVYKEWPDKFYKGKVIGYDKGKYKVHFKDNTNIDFSDMGEMMRIVDQAADLVLSGGYKDEGKYPNPYPVGTRVYYHFEKGWYNGYISNFVRGKYTITWSDFSLGTPDGGLAVVKQMVTQAAQQAMGFKPDLTELYDVGTPTYYKFKDGWLKGKITKYQGGWYTVSWEDDSTGTYDDLGQVKQMVDQGANLLDQDADAGDQGANSDDQGANTDGNNSVSSGQVFPIGTPVYKKFPDAWYTGIITGFKDGKYEITWSDDTVYYYDSAEKVQIMVDNAEQKAISEENAYLSMEEDEAAMGRGATAVVVIAVLAVAVGAVFVVIRRKRTGKEVPPPPPMSPFDGSPEKVSGTGESNIADLKATSADII